MATITDVAKASGVSISTVSHVLNGTRPVRDATRLRVEAAIESVGYRRDQLARSMRRARTDSVGLVVSNPSQPVLAEMIRGVEQMARSVGYVLLLANSNDDAQQEALAIDMLMERRIDGLILTQASSDPQALLALLRDISVPTVLLDRLSERRVDQVGSETVAPMKSLVMHLLEKGHADVALVAGDLSVPTLQERLQGYESAMATAQVPSTRQRVIGGQRTAREARLTMRLVLAGRGRPTAVVCSSTDMTAGTLQAMRDLGLRAPDDIALVSFDELPYAELISPGITSVVQPAFQIGEQGMSLLMRRLSNPEAAPQTIRLRPHIEHRESCGCPGDAPPLTY
jgi:LacI family transcriptional regulator